MISILIPTKNEERDLPACLESVRWSDDIWVYDSGSTDATAAVAASAGAHVVVRPHSHQPELFGGNEAAHKNWALENIPYKYPWVLHIDADERVTPGLAASLLRAVENPGASVAFRVRRRDFWGQCWLKHVQTSPYYLRLFRPEKMRYARLINPVSVPDGPVGDVAGYLDHYPFSKGIAHWLARHNSYSSLEARQILDCRSSRRKFSLAQAFFGKDFHERRFHQKELFYRMPARPLLKFLFLYLGKRGFLDGSAGFQYAVLQSFYEYLIALKVKELAGAPASAASSAIPAAHSASAALKNLAANREPLD